MQKAKTRVRTTLIPLLNGGNKITLEEIFYDLDKTNIKYSEKGIEKYIVRMCNLEGFSFDGEIISQ